MTDEPLQLKRSALGSSLVGAVQNDHIPLEEGSQNNLDAIIASNDHPLRQQERGDLESILKEIDNAVAEIDNDIREVVSSSLSNDFESIQDVVKSLGGEVESVRQLHSNVETDNSSTLSGLAAFAELYGQYENLMARYSEIDATIYVLKELNWWSTLDNKISDELENGRLDSVLDDLKQVNHLLTNLENSTSMLSILPILFTRKDQLAESVKASFAKEWDKAVSIEATDDFASLHLTRDCDGLDVLVSPLKSFRIFDQKVSDLVEGLANNVIRRILNGNQTIQVIDSEFNVNQSSQEQSPDRIFGDLTTLTSFLCAIFPRAILDHLVPSLLPSLTTNLLAQFLPSYIPSSLNLLENFDSLVFAVEQFENHIVNLGWSDETPLANWVSEASKIWYANRLACYLDETRELVVKESKNPKRVKISNGIDILKEAQPVQQTVNGKENGRETKESASKPVAPSFVDEEEEADGWNFDDVEPVVEEPVVEETTETAEEADAWDNWDDETKEEQKDVNGDAFPYSISNLPDGLLEIVKRVLDEGMQLESPRFQRSLASASAKDYPFMVGSILSLWRAIGRLQGSLIKFSTDALYLSHRLILYSTHQSISLEIQRLNECGQIAFTQEIAQIIGSFNTLLLPTHNFINTSDPEQTQKCTKAVKSIIHELRSLSKQYADLLPPQKRRIALGQLLSSVLAYMNTSLTELGDIGADESTFLISLYTDLFGLADLFSPYDVSHFVPEWLKSQYIRELLEWRMVDIMESWRDGLLQGVFTKEEIVGWLRKLFQDSENRARNIGEIRRG